MAEVTRKLEDEGFGIITDIDVRGTLESKIGVAFRPNRILGACNATLAHEALKLEDKVGTMLPCNVIVQELGSFRFWLIRAVRMGSDPLPRRSPSIVDVARKGSDPRT